MNNNLEINLWNASEYIDPHEKNLQNNTLAINLWNSFDCMSPYEKNLRNTTDRWSGMDNHETYIGLQQQNITTYTEDDFFYKFNSLGFRSDEFDNTADIKILYAGCSVTEGTGLPVNRIWGSFLNDQISKETNKLIKFFSVARGGSSIDTIVRYAYTAIEHTDFKPDFVYFMFPSILRREIIFADHGSVYTANFIPGFPPPPDTRAAAAYVYLDALINYRQSYNDCFRNLLFMKYYLMSKNIKWAFSFWNDELRPDQVTSAMGIEEDSDPSLPIELIDHHIEGGIVFDHVLYEHGLSAEHKGKFEFVFPQNIARDGAHFGPNSHYNFAKNAYQYLNKKDYFQELLTKWKN
jgi:hypothetical protein